MRVRVLITTWVLALTVALLAGFASSAPAIEVSRLARIDYCGERIGGAYINQEQTFSLLKSWFPYVDGSLGELEALGGGGALAGIIFRTAVTDFEHAVGKKIVIGDARFVIVRASSDIAARAKVSASPAQTITSDEVGTVYFVCIKPGGLKEGDLILTVKE